MLTDQTPISRHPSVVFRDLAEGGVLLHLDSGQYHGVNGTGLAIWELLDEARTLAELEAELRARVEDAPDAAGEDVRSFVEALRARDLVVVG